MEENFPDCSTSALIQNCITWWWPFFSVSCRIYLWYPLYLLTATARLNKQKLQRNVLIFALCPSLLKTLYTDTVFYFLKIKFLLFYTRGTFTVLRGEIYFLWIFLQYYSEARFKKYFFIKCATHFEYKTEIVTFGKPVLHM